MNFLERWNFTLSNALSSTFIPKQIFSIIKNYTLTTPMQQFRTKYREKFGYISSFSSSLSHSSSSSSEIWDKNIAYKCHDCQYCSSKDSLVEIKNCDTSGQSTYWSACKVCSDKIWFCDQANKDDEICKLDRQCDLCGTLICTHNIGKSYTQSMVRSKIICRHCIISSHFGRQCVNLIISKNDQLQSQSRSGSIDQFISLYQIYFLTPETKLVAAPSFNF